MLKKVTAGQEVTVDGLIYRFGRGSAMTFNQLIAAAERVRGCVDCGDFVPEEAQINILRVGGYCVDYVDIDIRKLYSAL
ncbi:MAG: hypothetical protein Q8N16_03340 [bacterium]|nr:hypothetical protein [bacterium]